MDIFYAPFCFRGVRSTFGHYDDMMIMILIRERAYDNNIRKILKGFRKQSLWWEHRNILEKLRNNHTVLRRDLLKVLQNCQNKRQLSQQLCQITHAET